MHTYRIAYRAWGKRDQTEIKAATYEDAKRELLDALGAENVEILDWDYVPEFELHYQ